MKKYIASTLPLIPLAMVIVATVQNQYAFVRTIILLSACLLTTAVMIVARGCPKRSDWLLVSAYACCMCGDSFLFHHHNNPILFATGVGLFGLAHLNYLSLMLCNGRLNKRFAIIITTLLLVYFVTCLAPLKDMALTLKFAVLIYLLLSCMTLSAAVGLRTAKPEKILFVSAISLMMISDTTISFKEFLHWETLNFLLMPTYYYSLLFMCLGMCFKLSRCETDRATQ